MYIYIYANIVYIICTHNNNNHLNSNQTAFKKSGPGHKSGHYIHRRYANRRGSADHLRAIADSFRLLTIDPRNETSESK